MNIPENILQQVADEAFLSSNGGMMGLLTCNKEKNHVFWHEERYERRAVIQHAISNPALAPFLAGGIGEYTDSDIHCAWRKAVESDDKFVDRIRAFLDALPRRESPAVADAIARAEKAEAELAILKSAQLGILRPLSEMPETVTDGCVILYGNLDKQLPFCFVKTSVDTHFAILRMPDAEAFPSVAYTYPQPEWVDAPEPAAQVPLGPEDVPPGSVFRSKDQPDTFFWTVSQVWERGFYLRGECVDWHLAMDRMEINTSIPDTGRWDANAWRPCSKPGKEVAK